MFSLDALSSSAWLLVGAVGCGAPRICRSRPSRGLPTPPLQGDPTYLVVTQEGTIENYGINAVCTHLGCVVPWVAVSGSDLIHAARDRPVPGTCGWHVRLQRQQGGAERGMAASISHVASCIHTQA